jgi:hypothetical protein
VEHVSHSISPQVPHSPAHDEQSVYSEASHRNSVLSSRNASEKFLHSGRVPRESHDDSQSNDFSFRKYRSTRSIASKNSDDEPPRTSGTRTSGKFIILDETYPSVEHEHLHGSPLSFLGAERFLRARPDWTRVRYPLSAYHAEMIIDLLLARPSFVREIPKVTHFNLYRSLVKTVRGYRVANCTHRPDFSLVGSYFSIMKIIELKCIYAIGSKSTAL